MGTGLGGSGHAPPLLMAGPDLLHKWPCPSGPLEAYVFPSWEGFPLQVYREPSTLDVCAGLSPGASVWERLRFWSLLKVPAARVSLSCALSNQNGVAAQIIQECTY